MSGPGLTVKVWAAVVLPPGATTVIASGPAVVRSAAGMTAVNSVALTNVVARATPLKSAVKPLTKFVPVSVIVASLSPAVADVGLMLVSVGAGLTVKVCAVVVLPPGATTVMESGPAVVRSAAGMTAVSSVALTKVVARAAPLKSAVKPLTKFVPVKVMVVSLSPAVAEVGLMLVKVGAGLTVNVCGADVPPPGPAVTTVIESGAGRGQVGGRNHGRQLGRADEGCGEGRTR